VVLAELHGLLDRLHAEMADGLAVAPGAAGPANAAEAFARKRGDARDLTHVFIGAAHSLGIPARYVSGYYRGDEGAEAQRAGHAWAEAFVPDLGWVAFDPAHGFCPTDTHVRVAIGLDSLGAAAVRGTRYGAGAETLAVDIKVDQ
jgi:transglutaminase-like putative cysteine protease